MSEPQPLKSISLSDRQAAFAYDIAAFIMEINAGQHNTPDVQYRARLGDAYRDPRAFGPYGGNTTPDDTEAPYGNERSLHKQRLAMDLIIDLWDTDAETWIYQTDTESYAYLGEIWEARGHTWGGRWNDGNHFQE